MDIERKYSFGKKFSEILGLIDDSRDKVDSVESTLRGEIKNTETSLKRDAEQIVANAKANIEERLGGFNEETGEYENLTTIKKEAQAKLDADGLSLILSDEREITNQSISTVETRLGGYDEETGGYKTLDAQAATVSTHTEQITKVISDMQFKVDIDAVNIAIKEQWSNGVDQVETSTGYRFDADGLSISKAGEEMSNLLDNTGMYVKRSGTDILTANSKGVEATNLHAKTYLIIGSGEGRSRLEDYGANRTGVFWIG